MPHGACDLESLRTGREAGRRLGHLTEQRVSQLRLAGRLRAVRVAGRWLYPVPSSRRSDGTVRAGGPLPPLAEGRHRPPMPELPLAAASARLKGKPGRPRTRPNLPTGQNPDPGRPGRRRDAHPEIARRARRGGLLGRRERRRRPPSRQHLPTATRATTARLETSAHHSRVARPARR
jgi:hypothetical protein